MLLIFFLASGLSAALSVWLGKHVLSQLIFPLYLAIISFAYYLLEFPLNLYQSHILEHKFALSRQSLRDWFIDQLKSGLLSYLLSLILLAAFYFILKHALNKWWIVLSIFWVFFSVILAKIVPVVVVPLFFKYKKLSDENLRQRIINLAAKMKVKVLDCFEIDFSKKTLKANAAFLGTGNTRRVILADTLKDKYSYDEIEIILAHEFAHYQLKHLLKLILVNALITAGTFYVIYKSNAHVLHLFKLNSLSEIAALPVLLIYFILFGIITQPLTAFISRSFERSADSLALEVTGLKEAFISTMAKLAEQNLADRSPHPLIKFFFFDHPPIDERIKMAQDFN